MSRIVKISSNIVALVCLLMFSNINIAAELDMSKFLLTEKQTEQTMEQARQAVAKQNYETAIKLYARVLSRGVKKYRQDALEFLGVAREKNGQYAHAKAEYEEYLKLYPEGEGAERVRMRLTGMLTALAVPREKLKKSRGTDKTIWDNYGYITSFYRRDKLTQNNVSTETSSSTNSIGLFSRRQSSSSNINMQVTGDYIHDFDDSDNHRRRLTSMYIDYANQPKTFSTRLGRQNHTRSGVLGRMDGIWMDYQFHPEWRINYVAGYPVNLVETNAINKSKKFEGVSLDMGTFNKYLDFNIFKIDQEVEGITDREAVGGEIRYISPSFTYFTLVDYDTYFDELNKFYLVTTWRLKNQKVINISYDRGKAPYITTSNALLGQNFSSISEMQKSFTEEEIKQLARDRTADSRILTLSGSFPVSKKYMMSLDLTVYNLGGTPPISADDKGTDATGDEYYYNAQLVGNDALLKNDTLILGLRYSDSQTYNRTGLTINERVNHTSKWRSNYGVYYEVESRNSGAESTMIRPSVGVDHIYSRHLRFEADILYDRKKTEGDTLPSKEEGLSMQAGLILDF